jgi:ferric-dicitrate binding protein FerR (iron transport regulator)
MVPLEAATRMVKNCRGRHRKGWAMIFTHRTSICLLALTLAAPTGASAATEIARAIRVASTASAGTGAQTHALTTGASLAQDEWVRTNQTGRADLTFMDNTQLTVGPSAAIKLDRFVYAPGSSSASFVLNATKGLFRFSTGNLPKDAYQIRTPTGVLGVRGTRFTFRVQPSRTVVSVTEGRVISCPRSGGRNACAEAGVGQSLITTPNRVSVVATASLPRGLGLPALAPLGIEAPRLRTELPLPLPVDVNPLGVLGGLGLNTGRSFGGPPAVGGLPLGGRISPNLPRLGR